MRGYGPNLHHRDSVRERGTGTGRERERERERGRERERERERGRTLIWGLRCTEQRAQLRIHVLLQREHLRVSGFGFTFSVLGLRSWDSEMRRSRHSFGTAPHLRQRTGSCRGQAAPATFGDFSSNLS